MSQKLYKTKMELEATLRKLCCAKEISPKKKQAAVKVNRRLNHVNRQIALRCRHSQEVFKFNLNK